MSFVPREERARRSRQAQFANGQRPGGSDVDPRQRRSSEAELQTSQRVGDGQEVDANGRAQVRKDKTIEVDSRNRHRVAADNLRFATPVDGSQAATKDYVDLQIAQSGTAYRVQTDLAFDQLYASPTGFITVPVVAGPGTTAVTSELDLGNLLAAGSDGILLKGGHSYIIRGGLSAISGNINYHQGRLVAAVKNATSGVLTILLWRTVRTSQQNRTHWTVEAVYTATEDVEAVLLYQWLITGSFRLAYPLLSAQRVAPYDEDNGPLPLPPLPDGFATISYNELTAVAWTDDLSLWGNGLPDADTFTWTFDEWGPTYLTYSGAYGAAISHRFMDGGTHTVELTASGPSGSDTATVDVVVQDVVETQNILASVGILDATGFDDLQTNVASQSVSSIAAPDGTLTAIETVATSSTVQPVVKALLFKTTGTYTQIGDLWQNGLAWTFAIYAYMGQEDAARITLQALTVTTAGVLSDQVAVSVENGSVVNFTSSSTGSVSYSAERNARVEAVGDTGWYRIEVTLQDYARTCDRIYLEIYGTSGSAYDRHITWNPTLRYGDWVSREKNWLDNDALGMTLYPSGTTSALSDTVAPDGTLSAVDLVSTDPSLNYINWYDTDAFDGTVPQGSRISWEFYMKHPMPGSGGHIQMLLQAGGVTTERVQLDIQKEGGFVGTIAINISAGPGYTVANCGEAEAIGADGWWRYRLSLIDYAGTITNVYVSTAHSGVLGDVRSTVWNPRLTVGNPADMLDYFVSGPQNLLGDGSDYSGWTAGVH